MTLSSVLTADWNAGSFWGEVHVLQIATNKVAFIISLAREFDVKVAPWDETIDADDNMEAVLENSAEDSYEAQMKSFIDDLNDDEQAHLVALMWVGRGTYEPEDFQEAVQTARAERVNETSAYLTGVPLLADYLEEGLQKLGIELEE